jgi:beta-fructofuranosidase
MPFALTDRWVWDSWVAVHDDEYHLYFLNAPKSLRDPDLRHRHATIGHAVSRDLSTWTVIGGSLAPGAPGDPDATATWTGSVVRHPDGSWRMFYTGSRFLADDGPSNVETIMCARSDDLEQWTKLPGVSFGADPRWDEVLGNGTWREEAWRDPWVFRDPDGGGWRMVLTARSNHGGSVDRGVVGHAWSRDLENWTVLPPLSAPGEGFAHLEVPQMVRIEGQWALIFSCDTAHLAGRRARAGELGGIWALRISDPIVPIRLGSAARLTGDEYYAGRVVQTLDGGWALLAFTNISSSGQFAGELTDPMPLSWSDEGILTARTPEALR